MPSYRASSGHAGQPSEDGRADMGVTKQLKEERVVPYRAKQKNTQPSQPPIVTFRPTSEEREELSAGRLGLEEAVGILGTTVMEGARLVVGHKPENGSYYAILRDATTPYENAVAVSYWHSDPAKCLVGLAYALAKRFPHFPDLPPTQLDLGPDW